MILRPCPYRHQNKESGRNLLYCHVRIKTKGIPSRREFLLIFLLYLATTAENNPTAANSTREVLVYNGSSPPMSLLGVVIVSPNMTVLNVLTMVKEVRCWTYNASDVCYNC
jgi:hypothetical protein